MGSLLSKAAKVCFIQNARELILKLKNFTEQNVFKK